MRILIVAVTAQPVTFVAVEVLFTPAAVTRAGHRQTADRRHRAAIAGLACSLRQCLPVAGHGTEEDCVEPRHEQLAERRRTTVFPDEPPLAIRVGPIAPAL
jgi:hypothetical protein